MAVLRMAGEVTNPINMELVNELSSHLGTLAGDPDVQGVVLTGSNEKFFSIGFDIPTLYGLDVEGVGEFYRAYNRLCIDMFTYSKPLVAALVGHAIAGGCILAICCDYRIIAEGKKLMGLNEVKLGLPVPYPAHCILQDLVGTRNAREMVLAGDFYGPDMAFEMGLVDEVLPLERVLSASVEKAALLGSMPSDAFAAIKRNLTEPVAECILSGLFDREKAFLERWFDDDTRPLLKEAMEKF